MANTVQPEFRSSSGAYHLRIVDARPIMRLVCKQDYDLPPSFANATSQKMRTFCLETFGYVPHAVFLSEDLGGWTYRTDVVNDLWLRCSRHVEFVSEHDALLFKMKFPDMTKAADLVAERQSLNCDKMHRATSMLHGANKLNAS